MADLAPTFNVIPSADVIKISGVAGEFLSSGCLVYLNKQDGFYYKADTTNEAKLPMVGMAVNDAFSGQPFFIIVYDPHLHTGSHYAEVGSPLFLGYSGQLSLATELTSGKSTTFIGITTSLYTVYFSILNSGVVIP
jgi:hypothetical protein